MPIPDLVGREVAESPQQVVDLVGVVGLPLLDEGLEAQLEVRERVRIEQLPELLLAEQLPEEVAVQREGLRPALGQRGVALVHVGRDVVEQQRAREGGGARGLDAVDRDLPPPDAVEDLAQGVEVEHVREAFAVRLHEDREAPVPRCDRQQVGRTLALLPQRGPRPGTPSRQEQRPRRVLAEPAREQARLPDAADHQVLDLLRFGEQQRLHAVQAPLALGQADRDPVVGPDGLDLEPEALLQAGLERHRPRGVDPATERRQHDQPPVTQLVAEPLHHDPPVRREDPGGLALVLEIREEVLGRQGVEVVVLAQPGRRLRPALRARRQLLLGLADEGTHRPPELDRASDAVALPERQLPGHARRGGHGHAIGADLRDAPRARAEDHDVAVHAGPQLVDHLLVELADAPAGRSGLTLEEDGEQAAVRDRAAAGHRDDAGVPPAVDRVGLAIPDHARLELGELVAWIGAGEHAEDALEGLSGQRLERGGAANDREQLVDGEPLADRHRDELLGEDVERVARQGRLLDGAVVHALHDDGRLEEVAAVLGEDDALAGFADLVPGAADALEPARDGGGALDLDHEVDGAHVDAELERARRHEGGEAAGLELLLDLEALLPRDAAVVGADQLLAGELVEALGEPLREAAAVREDDGAAVLADELEDPRVDRGPDAGPELAAEDRTPGLLVHRQDLAEPRHVLDRDDDLELERLARAGIDDADLAALADATEVPRDGLERPLRGAEADPLDPRRGRVGRVVRVVPAAPQDLEALQAQGEVGAALGAGDRVDLIDDHVLDAFEDLARLARQQQVQALRRGDEDVGRVADEVAALVGGRVAGPGCDVDAGWLVAEAGGLEGDARQRGAEVALDVVGQRLERAHVQDPDGAGLFLGRGRPRVLDEPVEAPQERGEGLAATRWGVDQRVVAAGDRRPALGLGRRGGFERRLEPGPDGGAKRGERIGLGRDHGTASIGLRAHFDQMFDMWFVRLASPRRSCPRHACQTSFSAPRRQTAPLRGLSMTVRHGSGARTPIRRR